MDRIIIWATKNRHTKRGLSKEYHPVTAAVVSQKMSPVICGCVFAEGQTNYIRIKLPYGDKNNRQGQ